MGWLQGAVWSTPHVMEAITAMKEKRTGNYPDLTPLKGFKEFG
jgi:enoyl-CoA hydratase